VPEPGAAAAAFFEDLTSRDQIPLLHNTCGTFRADLDAAGGTTHWYVTIDKGKVKVSHRSARADAVVRGSVELFDKMATGKANATAAMLRGVLSVEGDLELVSALARLLPGPPRSQATYLERQKEAVR
jgi:predicted lipid carrier protein YhbT